MAKDIINKSELAIGHYLQLSYLEDILKQAREEGATHFHFKYDPNDLDVTINFTRDEEFVTDQLATWRKANNAKQIAHHLNFLNEDECLVPIVDGTIGIAKRNESGYRKAFIILPTSNYHEVSKMVRAANRLIFPHRDEKETMRIEASSMR